MSVVLTVGVTKLGININLNILSSMIWAELLSKHVIMKDPDVISGVCHGVASTRIQMINKRAGMCWMCSNASAQT